MTTSKQKIRQLAERRRRSAFRDEFYKDSKQSPRAARKRPGAGGAGTGRVPLWVTVGGLGILFCIIAVGGSSAMIWLRQVGAMFGVHWIGD